MKKDAYYYHCPLESLNGHRLKAIIDKCEQAWAAASNLAKELGATRFTLNDAFLVGGIGQLYFTKKPNERAYETIRRRGQYFECYPNRGKVAGAKIFERIIQLPTVHFKELEPVFGPIKKGFVTPAFFHYCEDIYLSSTTPLEIDGLIETDEATWNCMDKASKAAKKKETSIEN